MYNVLSSHQRLLQWEKRDVSASVHIIERFFFFVQHSHVTINFNKTVYRHRELGVFQELRGRRNTNTGHYYVRLNTQKVLIIFPCLRLLFLEATTRQHSRTFSHQPSSSAQKCAEKLPTNFLKPSNQSVSSTRRGISNCVITNLASRIMSNRR